MRKGILLASLLVMVLVLSSLGFAATSHTVTVTVPSYASVSVGGTAAATGVDFTPLASEYTETGTWTHDITTAGDITLIVKTNQANGCTVSASAADFDATLPSSQLFVKVGSGSFTALATTAVELADFATKAAANLTHQVDFRLNLTGNEDPGSYSTTVIFTAAANS